jgi:hypothetical protein
MLTVDFVVYTLAVKKKSGQVLTCRIGPFPCESRNYLKGVPKSQMMPDQLRKWLRQQSKDFYAAGFGTLVRRRDKCIDVGGGYVEK